MNGCNMTYEAKNESPIVRFYNKRLGIDEDAGVSSIAALGQGRITSMKRASTLNKKNLIFNAKLNSLC